MCLVTASGKRLVGGNELQPTLNLSTLYTITNVLNSGVSSTIEALCRLDNQGRLFKKTFYSLLVSFTSVLLALVGWVRHN